MIMTTIPTLYRKAVAYAVQRLDVEVDYQRVEWELLNDPQFKPLIDSLDADVLYDCISEIMTDADIEVENRKIRNIQRWEDYMAEYPELDTHREF
jgi:hypothetical protein